MHGLRFLTVKQVQQLIDLAATRATNGMVGSDLAASVEDHVRELSADQQSELYALYWLGREPGVKPQDLDRLTEQARAFSTRTESFPSRQQLASKLRKGLGKLGVSPAV